MRALALAVLCVPALAHADIAAKGVHVGVNTFSLENNNDQNTQQSDSINTQPGFLVGGYITWRLSSVVGLQTEAQISEKRSFVEHCSPCMTLQNIELWYLELPVLLRIDFLSREDVKLHLDLGLEGVVGMGSKQTDAITHESHAVPRYVPGNLGAVGGFGFEVGAGPGRISVDVRYQRWAAPIVDSDDVGNNKIKSSNQVIGILGYAFP